jgi:hypothetical protein
MGARLGAVRSRGERRYLRGGSVGGVVLERGGSFGGGVVLERRPASSSSRSPTSPSRRHAETRGVARVFLPPQPDGFRPVSSGLNGPKPASRTDQTRFEVFWGVFMEPEKNTLKPAQTHWHRIGPKETKRIPLWLRRRCLRCFSRWHRAIDCRDPVCCLNCFCSGHREKECKQ